MRLFPLLAYACHRHHYWLGPPDVGESPALRHLSDFPDLLSAQRRHGRLVRLYGPMTVFDALVHAFKICAVLWKNGPEETYGHSRWWLWDQRLDQLIPKTDSVGAFSHSLCYAAIYPEAVTIAGLLAHPVWRVKAACPWAIPTPTTAGSSPASSADGSAWRTTTPKIPNIPPTSGPTTTRPSPA